MNNILSLGGWLVRFIETANSWQDRWLQSRIKNYAANVRGRYPDRLYLPEKILAPLIVRRVTGTVANLITVIRLLLAIIIFLLLLISFPPSPGITALSLGIFILAGLLDRLDGPTARALDEISEFGKVADPFTDKVLLAAPLVILGYFYLPGNVYWAIIFLEAFLIFIASLKIAASRLPFTMATQANIFGKTKLVFELIAGGFLFLCPFHDVFIEISFWFFMISIPLAVGSIIVYLASIRRIKK